jgi:hypothetical protein
MTNPYAPPAAASFALPEGPLPAGVRRFRIDPARARVLVRSTLVRRQVVALVVMVMLLGIYRVLGLATELSIVIVGIVWVMGVGLAWMRLAGITRRQVETFECLVSERVIRRIVVGALPAEILRPEITRVVEAKWGMWVICAQPRRALGLSRAIAGYDELRATLASWKPVEGIGGWSAMRLPYAHMRQMGPRDVVDGTALAADAGLREELAMIRAVSADRGAGYGPVRDARRLLWRVLLLWVLLIVMFLAIWQFLSPGR